MNPPPRHVSQTPARPPGSTRLTRLTPFPQYPHYLPTWDRTQFWPALEPYEHYEHGKDADTAYPNLFPAGTSVTELTPSIGSEVHGIQLSTLSDAGKDELAHYVATRKVVAFRKQDFADLSIPDALQYGAYFGRHHIHPTSGAPEGHPEIHLVHRGAGDKGHETYFQSRTSSVAWHSDISYEKQPPGTTFLYILDRPETGGDTLFVDAVQAYKRLSPLFQERLHGLRATHSGIEQVNAAAARNSIKRREPVVNDHPIVRTHPATGEKALYVNPQCKSCVVERFVRKHPVTNWLLQLPAISLVSRRKSRTRCSSSSTTTSPMEPTSRPASSGRRAPSSCGITVSHSIPRWSTGRTVSVVTLRV